MKNFLSLLLICFLISSCSDSDRIPEIDDKGEIESPETEIVKLQLRTKEAKGNIFELMEFYLAFEKQTNHIIRINELLRLFSVDNTRFRPTKPTQP